MDKKSCGRVHGCRDGGVKSTRGNQTQDSEPQPGAPRPGAIEQRLHTQVGTGCPPRPLKSQSFHSEHQGLGTRLPVHQ